MPDMTAGAQPSEADLRRAMLSAKICIDAQSRYRDHPTLPKDALRDADPARLPTKCITPRVLSVANDR